MLAFLTLLLGIITGTREVELAVPTGTASVEVLLDGERAGRRTREPWRLAVDFGETPAPHHLEAVARDGRGREIGRVRQMVNFPRADPEAEAALALLPGKGGTGRFARLEFESVIGLTPTRVTVSLDGKPIAAPDPARIELPAFVPERLHFLRAGLEFGSRLRVEAEITFGGPDRDETSRELTAVPVRAPGGRLPSPEAMAGWLTARGEPLRVVATESGDASIVVVLDADGAASFSRLRETSLLGMAHGTFHGDPEVRTLLPYPGSSAGSQTTYEVFPRSFPVQVRHGLLQVLAEVWPPWDGVSCPRVADAVTVAGSVAATWSHPRAVVVVLTGNPDRSVRPVRHARSYLADLGVPLFVWTAGSASPEAAIEWGGGRPVTTLSELRAAVRELDGAVREQRIVWVEGAHLPQSISISPKAPAGVAVAR